jgi:tetratricopeptide (TPR) repeat protein
MLNKRLAYTCFLSVSFLMLGCQSVPTQEPVETQVSTAPANISSAPEAETKPADDLFKLAMWSAKAAKTDDAINQFRQLIALDAVYPKANTNLGLLLLQKNQLDEASKAFVQAIELDDKDAIAYNHFAIIARQQGNFKQARMNYQKAIDADPDYANAYLNMGILMDIYLQDLEGALKHYKAYQGKIDKNDETIEKWVIDVQRRIDANAKKATG